MYTENITKLEKEYEYRKNALQDILNKIEELKEKQAAYISPEEAYKNAYESMFDGLKIVSNESNPIPLTFPMAVKANVFYKYDEKVYVCIKDGLVKDISEDYFEPWDI